MQLAQASRMRLNRSSMLPTLVLAAVAQLTTLGGCDIVDVPDGVPLPDAGPLDGSALDGDLDDSGNDDAGYDFDYDAGDDDAATPTPIPTPAIPEE